MELRSLHLDIAEMNTVDDSVLKAIGILLEEQERLRDLYIDFYDNLDITDEGINALSTSLQDLKELKELFLDLSGYMENDEDWSGLRRTAWNFYSEAWSVQMLGR